MLNGNDGLARHIRQRLEWRSSPDIETTLLGVQQGTNHEFVVESMSEPEQAELSSPETSSPSPSPVTFLLACSEEQFAELSYPGLFHRPPSVAEVLEIVEMRKEGISRARILRRLIHTAAQQHLAPPHDWQILLPRIIDVRNLLDGGLPDSQFIVSAYERILLRTPSPEEIKAQRPSLRRITRSDFLDSLASSAEALGKGGEVVLEGLGRRSFSLQRLLHQFSKGRQQEEARAELLRTQRRLEEFRSDTHERLANITQQLAHHAETVESLLHSVATTARSLAAELDVARRVRADQVTAAEHRAAMSELTRNVGMLQPRFDERFTELRNDVNRLSAMSASENSTIHDAFDRLSAQFHGTTAESRARLEAKVDSAINQTVDAISARVRPPVTPSPDVTVVQVDGFFIGIAAREWRASTYYHNRGPLEPGVYSLFRKKVRPGMSVVDVGANVGLYTLLSARLLEGNGRVFSFEPTPGTFHILQNNIQLNGFLESGIVKLHNAAVSDHAGHIPFFHDPEDSTHNSLYQDARGVEEIQVPTVTLDDVLGADSRIDFIKLDIEGAEPLAIRGMSQILKNNPHLMLVMEFATEFLHRAGHEPTAFLDELQRLGLRASIIDDATGELSPATPGTVLSRASMNLFLER